MPCSSAVPRDLASSSVAQPRSTHVLLPPADRLLALARRLEWLGCGARGNPETLLVERHEIAGELRLLARDLDG
jgi:hypothetical protein